MLLCIHAQHCLAEHHGGGFGGEARRIGASECDGDILLLWERTDGPLHRLHVALHANVAAGCLPQNKSRRDAQSGREFDESIVVGNR